MSLIRVLPDHLINQIAAGEVIERPASVAKELLENALDATARSIVVDLEAGGRRLVRVADDGEGIARDDTLLALERHATSKLKDATDLARIGTLGFRGEALPAVASVSRMTLTSARERSPGAQVHVEGGVIRRQGAAPHPKGTTVEVRDLFYNTPARAKFLRSAATELGHIVDLVTAYALALPQVAFVLSNDGRRLLEATPSETRRERACAVLGREWEEALAIEGSDQGLGVSGLMMPPAVSASSRRLQNLYVNGRLVRDRLLGHAVTAACEGFFPRGRHARLLLFVTCPRDAVDVNVHPAKAEVRFRDTRAAHDVVHAILLETLREAKPFSEMPSLDEIAVSTVRETSPVYGFSSRPAVPADATAAALLFAGSPARPAEETREIHGLLEPAAALAHYRESYIVAADAEGLLLIDQHAAHERILFEKLSRIADDEAGDGGEPRQDLLFPVTMEAPRSLWPRLDEVERQVDVLGFSVERFGETAVALRAIPALLGSVDPAMLLRDLLDGMEDEGGGEDVGSPAHRLRRDRILATVACHAAIKVRMPLSLEKMNYLINELFRTSTPLKCPHGRPAVLRFPHRDIERGFLRP